MNKGINSSKYCRSLIQSINIIKKVKSIKRREHKIDPPTF